MVGNGGDVNSELSRTFALVAFLLLFVPIGAAQPAAAVLDADFSGLPSVRAPVPDLLDDRSSSSTSSSAPSDEELDRHRSQPAAEGDGGIGLPDWIWTVPVGLAVAGVAVAGWSFRDRPPTGRDESAGPEELDEVDPLDQESLSVEDGSSEPFLAEPPPEGVDGLLEIAHAHAQQGDFEAAVRWFEMTVALRPRLPTAHFCLGLSLEQLGRDEEALEAFEHVEELGYEGPAPVYRQARVLARMDRTQEAMARLGAALAAEPELRSNAVDDPVFERFSDHPRFLALVGRL